MTHDELKEMLAEASKVFVLTDANVAMYWLPELKHWLDCEQAVEVVVKAGERYKTLGTARRIWKALLKNQADRQSVLVNLGGGTISDMGGFVASCYQRGIRFVNVPTTLLAMVDASIGGKNGVDLGGVKNQIGTFAEPEEVLVNPIFLSTLSDRELLSGIAEMVKYGYVADEDLLKVDESNYEQYILRAGRIKKEIVEQDFRDHGKRRILNFGHTVGHAIEAYSMTTDNLLTHGEAVAVGMWSALWLSIGECGLDEEVLDDYLLKMQILLSESGWSFTQKDIEPIMAYLKHDKKNVNGQYGFVLLRDIEKPVCDRFVSDAVIRESLSELMDHLNDV
ncbi:MAG: 3-dehydroquinate synthase [Bacteroidales bacterium]|nr:3-dehydroquinate synthase [Bacteroidales bacterium]